MQRERGARHYHYYSLDVHLALVLDRAEPTGSSRVSLDIGELDAAGLAAAERAAVASVPVEGPEHRLHLRFFTILPSLFKAQ